MTVDIEKWETRYSAKWPKRAKDIEKLGEMCQDRNYSIPDGFGADRLKTLEFDYGLAMAWKRGSNVEVFVYISQTYQIFDMKRKSAEDRLPRGLGPLMQRVADVVEAEVLKQPRRTEESLRRLIAGGTGSTPREENFERYRKSVKKTTKSKIKAKKSKK